MPGSSNVTLLAELPWPAPPALAIYKPERGERPLWDFPPGLHRRELAAFELSETLGWGLVPLTVFREGPYGEGSLQHFVDADFAQHYYSLVEDPAHHDRLRRICLFDLIANNADRKSGHCLLGEDGQIYAIDNGLCFHQDPKLQDRHLGIRRRHHPRRAPRRPARPARSRRARGAGRAARPRGGRRP